MTDKTSSSTDVAITGSIDPDSLRAVRSFAELENLTGNTVDALTVVSDALGDGFSLLSKKERLIDVPFIILGWRFNLKIDHPDQQGDFVSVYVMTRKEEKYIFNDGSTGIYAQVDELETKIKKGEVNPQTGQPLTLPMLCKGGLRVSRYDYENPESGETAAAETFYLNTDAVVDVPI